MTPIVRYMKKGGLVEDKMEAKKIQIRASCFIIIDDVLYRRRYSLLYLRCANSEEVDYVLHEIHKGICGNHTGASRKSAQSRILLANPIERHIQHRQSMRQVRRDNDAHIFTMALRLMGN